MQFEKKLNLLKRPKNKLKVGPYKRNPLLKNFYCFLNLEIYILIRYNIYVSYFYLLLNISMIF